MFPELNNLLSTTPDRTEQVRCRTDRKKAGPGSVQDCIRDAARWSRRVCRKLRASGSCSLKRFAEAAVPCLGLWKMGFWIVLRVHFQPPGPCTLCHTGAQGWLQRRPRKDPLACPESPSTLEHFPGCTELLLALFLVLMVSKNCSQFNI